MNALEPEDRENLQRIIDLLKKGKADQIPTFTASDIDDALDAIGQLKEQLYLLQKSVENRQDGP